MRYTPKSFRKFSELLIANTAIGSISFLALEAIGASIAISYGFSTAFWAILSASIIIFLTAIPISYHAAKYNIDIDLITRAAGFGYVGSTITSLIYASFSFIFFALEASIMAQAFELYFALPLAWGYLLSSLVIIPLVFYGITLINKLQLWTQPIWIAMMIAPFIAVLLKNPETIESFLHLSGTVSGSSEFNIYYFGFAVGISLSLISQIGEQVDYLRFMPPLQKKNRFKWWFSVLLAGPGWIILGFLKQLGGIFLASLVFLAGFSLHEAKTPIYMYNIAYTYLFDNPALALGAATLFVVISQIKINVTNAYAGSLAWSNFFSRVTHSHPGRVVWMLFNIAIALLLMELGLFDALEKVLGLYSNVAISWIGAITADLIVNKPLGLSPKIIEFKRAHLYSINPVGVGSMGFASMISIIAFMGFFGEMAQSYSSIIAMILAFTSSILIAYWTKGKYYIARPNELQNSVQTHYHCEMCDTKYEKEDMSYCPLHAINTCSLCCSLDSLCHDSCKKDDEKILKIKIGKFIKKLSFNTLSIVASLRLFYFVSLTTIFLFLIVVAIWMVYMNGVESMSLEVMTYLQESFTTLFVIIAILVSVLVWWILLAHENRKLAENELEEQYEILREKQLQSCYQAQMMQQIHDSVISTDLNGIVTNINRGATLLFGYSPDELIGEHIKILYAKEQYKSLEKNIAYLLKNEELSSEVFLVKKSSEVIEADLTLSILKDEAGKAIGMLGSMQDITQRKETEHALVANMQMLKYSQSVAHIGSWKLDLINNSVTWSDEAYNIFEVTKGTKISYDLFIHLIHPDDREMVNTAYNTSLKDKKPYEVTHRLLFEDSRIKYVKELGDTSFDEQDNPLISLGSVQDITKQKLVENELREQKIILDYQANHDALTGLPNRVLFSDRLTQALEKAKRNSSIVALFFIDLDHFKEINDSLGHAIGDEILIEVTKRFNTIIREEDTVARLGGDEFTIILEKLTQAQDASLVANKLLQSLAEAIHIKDHTLYISSSIGISIYPNDGSSTQNLLKYADAAMYKAKDEGRNNFQFYSSEMTELAFERVVMETSLRNALKNEEFLVYYQPQVNGITDKIIGMEALVRWNHPTMGIVSPDTFIPLAESTGMIVELDRLVMKKAMSQFSLWYKKGLNPGILALNLSIKQLQQKDFIPVLQALLEETECKSKWIELEVTEGQIMKRPEEAIKVLQKISDLGIKLAVDDFGTGYSSLAYLKKLPINKLKIDQIFVRYLPEDKEDSAIAKTIINLAKNLNLEVIAEGVETQEQKAFLIENGCENIQGYLYSKPIAASEIEIKLKNGCGSKI